MPWAKIDDQFYDHPKVVAAGPIAVGLFVCGLSYCNRHLTDGFISAAQVKRLIEVDNPIEFADKLVKCGLWENSDGGYQIHDYLEYNMSAEQIRADREANAKRVEEWREKKRSERNGVTNGASNTVTNDSDNSVSNTPPIPIPIPNLTASCANAQTPNYEKLPEPKRKPSERDIVIADLEKCFCQNTGLPLPPRRTDAEKKAGAKRWWNPLWSIYDISAGANVERAKSLMAKAITQMRHDNLTIAAPQSIQQIVASIAANGNGSTQTQTTKVYN